MIKISSIAVKDKFDVLKASEILEKIGIKIFSDEKTKNECLEWDDIHNNYLMQDENGWRIQSHLLKERFTIETLDIFVNKIIKYHPTIKEDVEKLQLLKNIEDEINKKLDKI